MLIVIEGDNGTGKDTLAKLFEEDGFHVVTWEQEVKAKEAWARTFGGLDCTNAFLDYTRLCEEVSARYKNSVIIRSWISTLSAAYAGGKFSLSETVVRAEKLFQERTRADFVFFLKCDFEKRIARINGRNPNSDDDRTRVRAERYEEISEKFGKMFPNWHAIDTTGKTPESEFQEAWNLVEQHSENK